MLVVQIVISLVYVVYSLVSMCVVVNFFTEHLSFKSVLSKISNFIVGYF